MPLWHGDLLLVWVFITQHKFVTSSKNVTCWSCGISLSSTKCIMIYCSIYSAQSLNSAWNIWNLVNAGIPQMILQSAGIGAMMCHVFPECVARVPVSLWGSGGWGCVRSTLLPRPQPFATVRVRTVWPCLWEVLQRWSFLEVSNVSLLHFAWQAWHFVTFRRVLERVESRFAWQAQYFCDVFRRCVAVFVAGAAL